MPPALGLWCRCAKPPLARPRVLTMGMGAKVARVTARESKGNARMAGASNRPISPHLQIWKWGPAMLVSILHRVSGDGLALVGLAVLLWWLGALAGGEGSYLEFTRHMTWAFFNHMASGLRHFVLDIGAGYELKNNAVWSMVTPLIALVLTGATWAYILLR
jgi:succinate dehydrogenase / fumarate reductase cytochrome b subunit